MYVKLHSCRISKQKEKNEDGQVKKKVELKWIFLQIYLRKGNDEDDENSGRKESKSG